MFALSSTSGGWQGAIDPNLLKLLQPDLTAAAAGS
jgi:hypothetical protein